MTGLRILGGQLRGRALDAIVSPAIRPTGVRTRAALFNILCQGALERPAFTGCRFLDLFAGSGAIGIEALSRGARELISIDLDTRPVCANLKALGLTDRAHAIQADATRPGAPPTGPVDFAFLDPPYHSGLGIAALSGLRQAGWMAPNGIAVLELDAGDASPMPPPGWRLRDTRRYGRALLCFLSLQGTADNSLISINNSRGAGGTASPLRKES